MRNFKLILCTLLLSLVTTSIFAGAPALSNKKTGTPENGKKYYIYADTYSGGKYVNRYLHNDNGTLKTNAAVDESSDYYVWTCTVTDGKYTFQNVGNPAKYLAHKGLADAAYNFTLGKANANHEGTTIWSDGASRYFVTKNDGSAFDQSTGTYNQTNDTWCTDYVFVEHVTPSGNTLSITTNHAGAGEFFVNGKAESLPYNKWENTVSLPVTITATASNPYKFLGFFDGETNMGKEVTIENLNASIAYEARFELEIFSKSTNAADLVPVRIYSNRNNSYVIKMKAADSYSGRNVNSGEGTYEENEIWYLVGTAESFKMYNKVAGTSLALKLAGTGSGSAATLANDGTELCLVQNADNTFGVCPTGNKGQSFNMHGGNGNDIKLYDCGDGGSKWSFKKIDTSKALTINYSAQLEGGYKENYKIGELSISIDGVESKSMLEKTTVPASRKCYLPEGAEFGMSTGFMCHGWVMTINGGTSITKQALPEGGLAVNVSIAVDTDNKYQYLYYSPGRGGHPYRIPAIATTANGYVFAINDFRPCGNDIGFGEVDLVMRYSTAAGADWDGHSWTDEIMIADGLGHTNEGIWKLGFGDPAVVADRENNEILVMSVCGNRTCWQGNYGAGTEDNPENPNRMSRIRIKFDEKTQQWVVGEPKEVTYDIYPLFKDENGKVHVGSMFIGAGRIAQSSKIKVGTHFRIYCAVWAIETGNGRYHNYALYSDDFGESWNVLGELGWDNSPAKYGNEPKCEELPDGSVLLSSRKGYGRYFNVFRYTDVEKGEGAWMGEVSTDQVGDLKWGSNDTNGEPLRIGNVLFQSAPTGNSRSDVAVFYKVLSNNPDDYTPTKLSNGWTKIAISDKGSAYSSMCILPSGDEIGLFYEEEPGGYSMVYVPLKLKDILPADVYEALSAVPPTYASEKSPVWHNIKFNSTGNVLFDNGAGKNAVTSTDAEADAAKWNVVGTKDALYLVSKLGNYLAFDAKNNRYTTTADKAQKVILTLKENIKGSWEIMRKGASKSMSEAVTRNAAYEVTESTICNEANQIAFNDLTPKVVVYNPNIFSTEENPKYFSVKFKNGGWVLADKGNNNNALTASKDANDLSQLWQFVGTPESFYMKSMNGNYLGNKNENGTLFYYSTTDSNNKTLFTIFNTGNNSYAGAYEIQRIGASGCMNMYQGAGNGKKLSEWTKGDGGNPVEILEGPAYPIFSLDNNEHWYYIQFGNGGNVIQNMGVGENVLTKEIFGGNGAQMWKLTGSLDNCQIINKNGNYMVYTDGRVKTSTSPDGNGFKIVATNNNSYSGMFEIRVVNNGNNGFNMNGGAGKDKEIALYTYGDSGNPLCFIPDEEVEVEEVEVVPTEFTIAESNPAAPAEKLTLWYTQPATATGVSNPWMEYSLPLGNGQFGASLFGGVARDEILFNDKTVWSGAPGTYGEYLPFGSVLIDDISGDFESSPVKNYYRDLNLKTATGTVTYENAEGVKFTRQYIASNPDKAIVSKITASEAGKLYLHITMKSGKPTVKAKTTYKDGYAQFTGKLQTVSYNATLKVVTKGGFISTGADGITIEGADEVMLVLVGTTDFVGNDPSHISGNAENMPAENKAQADKVAEKGWEAVYAAHVADHQKFFTRVELELDGVENNLPTNELITAYNAASGARNLMLEQLYYNYGRYLSIASSRGVDLPNNLQGIWNNTCTPPWHSDIHANINVQMNYWPVSAGNLNEMYEPFLNYIINEAAQPEWRTLASNAVNSLNNTLGTSTPVREDSWTCLTENNIFGGISGFAPNYVIANAWYVTHMWQHYRYTLDKEYLAKAFPAMKGSSLFWADRMVLAADNTYECPNEYSPEHGPGSENAVAHAQQIAWESIDNTIKAADILGGVAAGIISQADYDLLKDRLAKMDRGLAIETYEAHDGWPAERNGIKTGDKIIREWKYSRFYASNDQGHRHMSHLMALFPFGQLTEADGELFEAAINSMKLRGDESTGWSMGWKINLWARALMPERSHAVLRKALKHSTTYGTDQGQGGIYYNLFDSHAPFQIDGNFGATSGINEMLMQSHTEVINILPALPAEWSKGSVKGLKAVGDFTVDIKWEGNQARKVVITNNQGQPCYVKCVGLDKATATINGVKVELVETTHSNLPCYKIASNAGDEIVIDLSNATQNNKTALEALIAETENLVNECYDYFATEVALQATNASGDYYVSTNAQEDSEGPIANLVDGGYDNHFHSEYSSNVGSKHYIDIKLGANNATKSFRFKYATRKAETNFPKTIEVYGYNNEDAQTLIATVTDLPVGNTSENKFYASGIIESETAYTCLRFVVTANNSGNKEAGGNPYFHMAEFDLMPRTAEYVNNYPNAVNVPAAVEKANDAIETAKSVLNTEQTVTEYNTSLTDLQKAYDRLVAAIESGSLPVLITTDVNSPIVYKIGIKRGDTKVLQYDLAGTKMVAVVDYAENNMLQGWYFTKGSADGKAFIHPYLGGGDVLSAKSTGNAHSAVWSAVKGAETHQEWMILNVTGEEGVFNIKAGDGSNYFSNNGGTSNKMGFWSSDPSSDTGSLFTFTDVEFEGGVWYNTLDAYNSHVCTESSITDGTGLGYYSNGAPYNSAKESATAVLLNEDATEDEYKSAYVELRAAKEGIKFNAPEVGKYYRIKVVAGWNDDAPYLGAENSTAKSGRAEFVEGANANSIFYFDGNQLVSYTSGHYLVSNSSFLGYNGVQTEGSKIGFHPSSKNLEGAFNISFNNGSRYLYCNKSNYTDAGGGTNNDNGYCFNVEEVTSLPVTVTAAGYATFYAPVAVEVADGVTAHTVTTDGEWAVLSEAMTEIPVNTGVVLVADEGVYNMAITTAAAFEGENLMNGTVAKTVVTKEENTEYYALAKGEDGVGMYVAVNGGTTTEFINGSHKAYLAVEGANGIKSFSFRIPGTTGIDEVTGENEEVKVIYDLQGRKLTEITKPGLYIVNGNKVLVK